MLVRPAVGRCGGCQWRRFGGKELSEFGKHWGSAAMAARGRVANENTPKLRTFDSAATAATRSSFIRPITS